MKNNQLEFKPGFLSFIPHNEVSRVRVAVKDKFARAAILADIFRLNTLYMIERSGSGHLGSSMSSLDIITWLWLEELNKPNRFTEKNHDIYFSSKGHDAPAFYAMLAGLGEISFELIHKLRRLGGLPGHPDIGTPRIASNTGSLGMGISKAKGMVLANRRTGRRGKVFVMTGDGELQEGQIWESLGSAVNRKMSEITVIVDHNKMQSDNWVKNVSDLGDLPAKFRSFGWHTARVDGHDFRKLSAVLNDFRKVADRPKALIADTIKGKGVSFMESTAFFDREFYNYHAGALPEADYQKALTEILDRINGKLRKLGLFELKLESVEKPLAAAPSPKLERTVSAYGDALFAEAKKNRKVVVLDADLWVDCGTARFKKEFPDRFFQMGIAEQDMVSAAGGMALRGALPIVHSFASFLSTRANEQIYNNASEKKKIIYVGTLAGLLPAAPGHSHQSVRDISALGGTPGLTMLEPANETEARLAARFAISENKGSTYLRFCNLALELPFSLPKNYRLRPGVGATLRKGREVAIVSYGPVMLRQAILAADILEEKGVFAAVIDLPWLNRADLGWLKSLLGFKLIVTIDDHYVDSGQGIFISGELARHFPSHPKILSLGLSEIPECGAPAEILRYHKLDAESIAARILKSLPKRIGRRGKRR